MASRFLIYGLVDPRTDEVRYIGQSSSGLIRPLNHGTPSSLQCRRHSAHWLRSLGDAGLHYGVRILEELSSRDDLDKAEIRWIAAARAAGWSLTNHNDGGGGNRGWKASAETKAKMSTSGKRRMADPAERAKVSAASKGRPVTAAQRAKISATLMGHTFTQATKDKIAATLRAKETKSAPRPAGWHHTEEAKRKIGAGARWKRTPEMGAKISAAKSTVEHRALVSDNTRKMHAARSPERRTEIALKAWTTRRAKAGG